MALPPGAYELQTLFGMGDAIQRALVSRGHRVRVYTPYGAMLPGMAYLVRRLLENTSNESFLKASFTERARIDDLLRDPEEIGAMLTRPRRSKTEPTPTPVSAELPPFRNEPPTDFARAENREAMRRALDEVRGQLGGHYPLIIGGEAVDTRPRRLLSLNPSHSSRVVGETSQAVAEHAEQAVAAAANGISGLGGDVGRSDRAAVLIATPRRSCGDGGSRSLPG